MKNLAHVASRFINTPLMMHPPKLEVLIKALEPRLGFSVDQTSFLSAGKDELTAKLNASYGEAGSERSYQILENGIAVIPVQGTLMKKSSWMDAYSGCCSYLEIQDQISEAMADGGVQGVLLDIDSPGGETSGCFELSDFIHSQRGLKPIYAVANDCALSAAYAIASAADMVFVTRTGAVGSIGVYALHSDQANFDKQIGVKYTYVFAGDKKVDGNPHEPLSERAKEEIQQEVSREYDMFVDTVSRNRSADRKAIVKTQAGLLWAEAAIPLLADEVGTFDQAVEAIQKVLGTGNRSKNAALAVIPIRGEQAMSKLNADSSAAATEGTTAVEDIVGKTPAVADAQDGDAKPGDTGDTDDSEEAKSAKKKAEADALVASVATLVPGTLSATQEGRTGEEIVAISNLCKMAGSVASVTDFLTKRKADGKFMSVAEVSEELTKTRVAESEKQVIESQVNPNNSNAKGIEQLESQAKSFASQNRNAEVAKLYVHGTRRGVTEQQAYAQMLEANPEQYGEFRNKHNAKALIGTLERAGYRIA